MAVALMVVYNVKSSCNQPKASEVVAQRPETQMFALTY